MLYLDQHNFYFPAQAQCARQQNVDPVHPSPSTPAMNTTPNILTLYAHMAFCRERLATYPDWPELMTTSGYTNLAKDQLD